jgi:uncharacterized protein (DUF2141 family)
LKREGSYLGLVVYLLIILVLESCASSGTIEGGPRDIAPPKLVKELSSPALQLNTKDRIFTFKFDEYIQVKDVVKQVQVSPPLLYIPKVRSRGKELVFELNFKETLRDSTTYTINFGEAIGDLHEDNKFKNFSHVFSTGDIIDTMAVKGQVTELVKGSGLNNVVVMLYDDFSDSAIIKRKPSYSIRVDNDGKYVIKNIKNGKYNVFALQDDNSTYTYEEATEMIAFLNEPLEWKVLTDTVVKNLVLSKPEIKTRIAGKSKVNSYGSIRIKLNNPLVEKIDYTLSPTLDYTFLEEKQDSLILHYNHSKDIDTISWNLPMEVVKIAVPKASTKPDTLLLSPTYSLSRIRKTDTIYYKSQTPIQSINPAFIVAKDTALSIKLNGQKKNDLEVKIYGDLKEKKIYDILLYPGAIIDIFGNVNDTITFKTATFENESLSKIDLKITDLDSTVNYVIELTKEGRSINKQTITGASTKLLKYTDLIDGQYEVLMIEDKNNNGRYDGSNYWTKRQAEIRKEVKLDPLKEYWKLETTVKFKD